MKISTTNIELESSQVLDAYQAIVGEIIVFVGNKPWDEAGAKYEIFEKMISAEWWRSHDTELDQIGSDIPREISKKAHQSIYYLRDHLINSTGNRIWGLTFTLYPTGKFNIEYDYNQPQGYNETDDIITGDEINKNFLK